MSSSYIYYSPITWTTTSASYTYTTICQQSYNDSTIETLNIQTNDIPLAVWINSQMADIGIIGSSATCMIGSKCLLFSKGSLKFSTYEEGVKICVEFSDRVCYYRVCRDLLNNGLLHNSNGELDALLNITIMKKTAKIVGPKAKSVHKKHITTTARNSPEQRKKKHEKKKKDPSNQRANNRVARKKESKRKG